MFNSCAACGSANGSHHMQECSWAKSVAPEWLPTCYGYHKGYMDALIGTIVHHKYSYVGKIDYLWLGREGWPVTFKVKALFPKSLQGGIYDWSLANIRYLDYNLPRPTAEQIYESISQR